MKIKILLAIGLLWMVSFAELILDVPETEQRENQWCWAGVSYSILTYYGDDVSQGQIAQFGLGDSTYNCWNYIVNSGQSEVTLNGSTYYVRGINQIMDNWNTPNTALYSSLAETEWDENIDALHPFVVRWGWTSGGGHFVVGMGYLDNGNIQIMDPWYGNGYVVQTRDWVQYGTGDREWTHTLTTNRTVETALLQNEKSTLDYSISLTNNAVSFSVGSEAVANVKFDLFNVAGKQIGSYERSNQRGAGSFSIDKLTSNKSIANGVYFLKMTAGSQSVKKPIVLR